MRRSALLSILLLATALAAACRRSQQGSNHVSSTSVYFGCHPDGGSDDDDLAWTAGASASVIPPQSVGWNSVSTDPECASLGVASMPFQFSWAPPQQEWCETAVVDGQGDLALPGGVTMGGTLFFTSGGGGGTVVNAKQHQGPASAIQSAFWLSIAEGIGAFCARRVAPDGSPTAVAVATEGLSWTNPLGGFVQSRWPAMAPYSYEFQIRWVTSELEPLSDWQTAMSWSFQPGSVIPNISAAVYVDRQGRALVLSFLYPPIFGAPPPPSSWQMGALWMGPAGPISNQFQPIMPVYVAGSEVIWIAGWGSMVPLPGGGFAAYQKARPISPTIGGTTSPSGWYASYPSGEARTADPPPWLEAYDGSLQMLAGGAAFGAVHRDPDTCARTALLIAPSGRTCFVLPLQVPNACDYGEDLYWADAIWPDGTLVLQNHCDTRWWPGLMRLK